MNNKDKLRNLIWKERRKKKSNIPESLEQYYANCMQKQKTKTKPLSQAVVPFPISDKLWFNKGRRDRVYPFSQDALHDAGDQDDLEKGQGS